MIDINDLKPVGIYAGWPDEGSSREEIALFIERKVGEKVHRYVGMPLSYQTMVVLQFELAGLVNDFYQLGYIYNKPMIHVRSTWFGPGGNLLDKPRLIVDTDSDFEVR